MGGVLRNWQGGPVSASRTRTTITGTRTRMSGHTMVENFKQYRPYLLVKNQVVKRALVGPLQSGFKRDL